MSPAVKQRSQIRELLAHPRCNEEIRVSLAEARRVLDAHRVLTARWEVRLMRYADALRLADERAARGETPFLDLPRERKAEAGRALKRPRTVEERDAHAVAFVAPDWTRDPSLLPKRPPGRP